MQQAPAKAPGGKAHVAVLLVDQVDFGAAPGHPEPIRSDDERPGWLSALPFPTVCRFVALDHRTKREPRQEIHLRTKCPHWCLVCRRTSQKQILQNDSVQQPSVGANG